MNFKRFTIDGVEILFVNAYRESKRGFTHETEFFIDGWSKAKAACYYINRTWERYAFQSVMIKAVRKYIEQETRWKKRVFTENIGCKNLMERHAKAFSEYLQNDPEMQLYQKIMEALN